MRLMQGGWGSGWRIEEFEESEVDKGRMVRWAAWSGWMADGWRARGVSLEENPGRYDLIIKSITKGTSIATL